MQPSQILQICHLHNANVFIFLICQILMEYFHCLKLWVLVDVSQWVILTETHWAIKFWQGPKKPSLVRWGILSESYHTVKDKKTPRPFCFLARFPLISLKFILISHKGHWFKMSAFQIWLPPVLLFSLPYLQWLFPQHYDLILPSKYAILHPGKYLGKNQLLHMHAQTQ